MLYIGSSPHHVEWSVTAGGHRFKGTCQVVARKALRALCQIYEEEVADTPLRFFPPFLLSSLHFKNAFPFPSLRSQMEVRCQTSFCQNEDGFPKLLRACTVRLGIRSQPEYDGCEFVEHGTEKCVMTVYIGSSPHHVIHWIQSAPCGMECHCWWAQIQRHLPSRRSQGIEGPVSDL